MVSVCWWIGKKRELEPNLPLMKFVTWLKKIHHRFHRTLSGPTYCRYIFPTTVIHSRETNTIKDTAVSSPPWIDQKSWDSWCVKEKHKLPRCADSICFMGQIWHWWKWGMPKRACCRISRTGMLDNDDFQDDTLTGLNTSHRTDVMSDQKWICEACYFLTFSKTPQKSFVHQVMCQMTKAAETNMMSFIQLVGDQPVYTLIVQLKNDNPQQFGLFHTHMSAIKKRLKVNRAVKDQK